MEALKDILSVDTEILGGQPVFSGTRVPIETLFYHIENGITIDEFLEDFPGVTKKQVLALLDVANKLVTAGNIEKLYEIAS